MDALSRGHRWLADGGLAASGSDLIPGESRGAIVRRERRSKKEKVGFCDVSHNAIVQL
jgi:hypothetical protein